MVNGYVKNVISKMKIENLIIKYYESMMDTSQINACKDRALEETNVSIDYIEKLIENYRLQLINEYWRINNDI